MRINKFIIFIFQFVTIGLAAAFVILYLYPQFKSQVEQEQHVIEVKEAPVSTGTALPHSTTSYADAVEKAAPAVVNIFTQKLVTERVHPLMNDPLFRHFFGENQGSTRQRLESSLGSGVIINPEGYILTNNHVIEAADEIEVALRDGRTASAKIVGTDPDTDLAILKIEMTELHSITLGHSKKLRVGDVVLAIGNPFGVGQTVTSGIVSATGRNMLGINTFENFIQTDAAINPGNSGGALITAEGNLIGINTAIFSRTGGSQGIGFAIPIDLARDVMQQIIEHGEVIRGWLGVAIQDLNEELAQSFELKSLDGVIISNIIRNGPADQAGLRRGDVITSVNGNAVKDVRAALTLISQARPGTTIKIGGIRQGEKFEVEATVLQRPKQQP
jgi:serine protease DegS